MLILAIDGGSDTAKTVGEYGVDRFKTNICDWFVRNVKEDFGADDMEFEIDGRKGFAGTIAKHEDEFGGGAMYGDSKAHEDAKIRIFLALYRYINLYCPTETDVSIIVGQPFSNHNDDEKNAIKNMLQGYHEFVVNGHQQCLNIVNVEVAVEGGGAFWCNPTMGVQRIIDIGSGTVNAITLVNKRILNNASGTFNFGVETIANKSNLAGLAGGIIKNTTKLKWKKGDTVYLCGGVGDRIEPLLKKHFVNLEVMSPSVSHHGASEILPPVFANAVGFYEIAKIKYNSNVIVR